MKNIEGMRVVFWDDELLSRYSDAVYTVELVHPNTGAVKLEELDGFFDPAKLKPVDASATLDRVLLPASKSEKAMLTPKAKGYTGQNQETDVDAVAMIKQLDATLPMPFLSDGEIGVADVGFYRCPVVGRCFCGAARRTALGGIRCERGHPVNDELL